MTTINTAGRYVGDWPKVGIRPAVDGRQHGVRESLEEQTRAMALRTADLIRANLRYPDGTPVEVVVPEHNIGGVYEAAKTAELFRKEGVGVSITVTPCWCYGSETMDMDPLTPKAVWGFNGTERPGAVYLAAVLAAHTQKGLPAFGIYGRDVQDAGDGSIPADVQEKILRFARAGLAAALLRGKSYLSLGGVSMGIAGSIVDQPFFEKYLGMRVECVDMSELTRRLEEGIYDPVELEAALAWTKANCTEGADRNTPDRQKSREEKDRDWETVVKMTLIARDLMVGNPRLAELGFGEEAMGRNAILGGFQGQRQWTDHSPNGDFMEAILNSSFDWNGIRAPHVFATENDSLNGATMLLSYLLTNRAQIFADVRTYWSPEAVERVTGHGRHGSRGRRVHPPHQLRCGDPRRHGRDDGRGRQARDEALLGDQRGGRGGRAGRHHLVPGQPRLLPRRRLLDQFVSKRRHAGHHGASQPRQRRGARAPDRRGLDRGAAERGPRRPGRADQPHLADPLVRPARERRGPVPRRLHASWPTGRPTTGRSATATSART